MSDTRTDTARDNDDSDIIDQAVADSEPDAVAGTAGGDLARDIGSRDEGDQVAEPDTHTRVTGETARDGDGFDAG